MQDKRKVLYVITKSNFGGAQRYLYDLVTNLPLDAFEPVVALGGSGTHNAAPGKLKELLEARGIRVVVVRHFMRDMAFMSDVRAFFELAAIVRRERPDVLHATSSKAGGLGALVGTLLRVPTIIFTSHGLTFDESWRPAWQRLLIRLTTWFTVLLSTNAILISRDTYERVQHMPFVHHKAHLVPNGIRTPDFVPREEAREVLLPGTQSLPPLTPWIGTVAEYHPNKNLEVLIAATALLNERGIASELFLIGDGDTRERLSAAARTANIEGRVHLTGYVPDAARFLRAFDIFCLPSKKEGLPYVLLEAGLAALPVVVSSIPGVTDIVKDKETGLCVAATPEAVARALETLIRNTSQATRYGQALHEHVVHSFSIERMTQETVALYVPTKPSNS